MKKSKPFWISLSIPIEKDSIITFHTGQTLKVLKYNKWNIVRQIFQSIGFNMHINQAKVVNHPPQLCGWSKSKTNEYNNNPPQNSDIPESK